MERLLESPRLPSLPAIALEVIELVQQQDVNVKQIAQTIQHDPALATRILKTVNSSFYGQTHAISTISHALVVLGLNSVKTLTLGFSLANNLKHSGGEGFDHMGFWKRSLYSATAARVLAGEVSLPQQEETFIAGLLQNLGMFAMNQVLGEEYTRLLIEVGDEHQQLAPLEHEAFDLDHAQVGEALARKWHLPPLLCTAIGNHENPDVVNEDEALHKLIRCVSLGSRAADVFITSNPGEAMEQYYLDAEQWFDLTDEQAEPLLRTVHTQTNEMRRLFDLPTGPLANPDDILARANEALLQISLQTQQKTSQLQKENRELAEQAWTDSLTGAANRGRFNVFIKEQFERTTHGAGPVSLLFLDTDHFKKFNDTYGHQTGDHVLVQLAGLLQNTLPDAAMVARYGGEEFAVVLPETDRRTAARLAEQLRLDIANEPIKADEGEQLQITASIGVATHDGSFFNNVEQLIKAADKGVYAAKDAGRNAVRIFTPHQSRRNPAA
ncbi:HDOD domain-containing protein [Phycisphaerales bacterium AB-hyl4]|uniref:diguanylate cyclase n=1 Tax=Natronomicrosphaera hydrolytica TaxID=3242702 RepID=A0ABV4TZX2_9BACT